jgi:tRNA pseudouridine55 synthase
VNGILLIDKPAGWTSMDVCAVLRGALKEKRIGHSGTLDPMATGLLVVFLGRATRAVQFAEAHSKTYDALLRPGVVTDTQDVTGTVLETRPAEVSDAALESVLTRFRGEIRQIPPMYSAIKVNGKKLYDLARKGREVERQPRSVTIHALDYTGRTENGDIALRIACSKGTYVRTLCHDIGGALGCGGCMSALCRVRCGEFDIADAHTLEEVLAAAERGEAERLLLPVDALFAAYPAQTLTAAQEKCVRSGGRWTCAMPERQYRFYGADGAFLALGEVRDGSARSVKSFFEVS